MNDIYDRLSNLLVTKFGVGPEEIGQDATFIDLDLDSLALVELTVAAQEEFGVDIGDGDLSAEDTLADTADLLTARGARV